MKNKQEYSLGHLYKLQGESLQDILNNNDLHLHDTKEHVEQTIVRDKQHCAISKNCKPDIYELKLVKIWR